MEQLLQELGDDQQSAHSAPIVVTEQSVPLGIYIYCIAIIGKFQI